MISSENPGMVALFAQANSRFDRLLINKSNFTVVSITPTSDPNLNTRAEIEVDRTIAADGSVVRIAGTEERFFRRSVEFHRLNLADILPLQHGVDGKIAIPGWDNTITDQQDITDQFIAGFTAALFTSDDIYIAPTGIPGTYVAVAKPTSLGYVGRCQFDVTDEEPAP